MTRSANHKAPGHLILTAELLFAVFFFVCVLYLEVGHGSGGPVSHNRIDSLLPTLTAGWQFVCHLRGSTGTLWSWTLSDKCVPVI